MRKCTKVEQENSENKKTTNQKLFEEPPPYSRPSPEYANAIKNCRRVRRTTYRFSQNNMFMLLPFIIDDTVKIVNK